MLAAVHVLDICILCNVWVCSPGQCNQAIVYPSPRILTLVTSSLLSLSTPPPKKANFIGNILRLSSCHAAVYREWYPVFAPCLTIWGLYFGLSHFCKIQFRYKTILSYNFTYIFCSGKPEYLSSDEDAMEQFHTKQNCICYLSYKFSYKILWWLFKNSFLEI